MKKLVSSGAAALLTFGTAFATDLPSPMPPLYYAPPPEWTGPFLGGSIGVAFGSSGNQVSGKDLFCGGDVAFCDSAISEQNFFAAGGRSNGASAAGGAQLGYNYQFGQGLIIGGVIDFTALNRSGDAGLSTSPLTVGTNVTETRTHMDSFQHDWIATARLRAGPTFDDLWVYATGGLALGGLKSSSSSVTTWNDPFWTPPGAQVAAAGNGSSSGMPWGYVVGLGGEYRFMPNWSIFAEYLFYSLSRAYTVVVNPNSVLTGISGPAFYGVRTKVDGNFVKVGVNYSFSTN